MPTIGKSTAPPHLWRQYIVRRTKRNCRNIGIALWGNNILVQIGLCRRDSQFRKLLANYIRNYRENIGAIT